MSVRGPLKESVLAFSRDPYVLGRDLAHLDAARDAGAPEAIVLYAARALEALVREAVDRLGRRPSRNVLSNIYWLQTFELLDAVDRTFAHAIRRLGNDTRHVGARHELADGEVAIALLASLLDWFFCRFVRGPRLESLTNDGRPYRPSRHPTAHDVIDAVTLAAREGAAIPDGVIGALDDEAFRGSPGGAALDAMAAEALIGNDEILAARTVVERALARNPRDVRLTQLQGLVCSREGRVDDAIRVLRSLRRRDPNDDETLGILAGALKRKAELEPTGRWLAESHDEYARGWQASRHGNLWLGINAATTALWLGRPEDAHALAAQVHAVLAEREDHLDRSGAGVAIPYWTQVTRAEALLLMGRFNDAGREYRSAFDASGARHRGDVRTSREQAERILARLDPERTIGALLAE